MQLRNRLLLLNLTVIGASSLLLVTVVYFLVAHQMRKEMRGFLTDEFGEYSLKYQASLDDPTTLAREMREHFTQARMAYPIACQIYDEKTRLVVDVDNVAGAPHGGPDVIARALAGEELRYTLIGAEGTGTYWYAIKPVRSPSGKTFAFELGLRIDRVEDRIALLRNYLLATVPVILILSAVGARWVARRSLQPFGDMLAQLQQIRSSSLGRRLPVRGTGDEVDRLGEAVNEMLADMSRAFSLVTEFTGDAAHELRTPLARLAAVLETSLDRQLSPAKAREVMDEAYEETMRLRRLIDDLMLLSRLDSGEVEGEMVPVDLADVLADMEELWSAAAEEKNIHVEVTRAPSLLVEGRPALLRRLLANLVDNALRHTPAGGSIRVAASATEGSVEVVVSDSGPGIAPEEIPKLFNRFYRSDSGRGRETGGTGLGLSICSKVAELHGGVISIDTGQGRGTILRVVLPAAGAAGAEEGEC